jgi:anti-sigma B factor antagonist
LADPKQEARQGRLELRSHRQDGTHLISLSGELDLQGCPQVEAELLRAEQGDAGRILVDLSHVDFIDSTGIALLVAAMRRNEGRPERLRVIASESDDVQRLLEVCGLDRSIPFLRPPA